MRKFYACPYNVGVECCYKPTEKRCFSCGHNPIEAEKRLKAIEAGAMKTGVNGVKALHVAKVSTSDG